MSTESSSEPLALIAGSTQMPCVVAREAKARGRTVTALAIEGVTDAALNDVADTVHWLRWGDVGAFLGLLGRLKTEGVREAVMAGKVEQQKIYESNDDRDMERLLESVPIRHTDKLIEAVVNLLAGAGIELLNSTEFLQEHILGEGELTARRPDDREEADILHGWTVAKSLGGLDIGQSVVVKDRAVVAVEAMEGTDACIERAGDLAGPGTVVVKVAKPDQDLRFDVPVIGLSTVATMVTAGASVLCVESGCTVIFDREEFSRAADEAGLAVIARRQS